MDRLILLFELANQFYLRLSSFELLRGVRWVNRSILLFRELPRKSISNPSCGSKWSGLHDIRLVGRFRSEKLRWHDFKILGSQYNQTLLLLIFQLLTLRLSIFREEKNNLFAMQRSSLIARKNVNVKLCNNKGNKWDRIE